MYVMFLYIRVHSSPMLKYNDRYTGASPDLAQTGPGPTPTPETHRQVRTVQPEKDPVDV